MILLTNKSVVFHIPYLPTGTRSNHSLVPIQDVAFRSQGQFSSQQFGQDSILHLLKSRRSHTNIDNILQDRIKGRKLNQEQETYADYLRAITFNPARSVIFQVCTIIGTILLLYIAIRVIWAFRKPIVSLIVKLVTCLCCFWRRESTLTVTVSKCNTPEPSPPPAYNQTSAAAVCSPYRAVTLAIEHELQPMMPSAPGAEFFEQLPPPAALPTVKYCMLPAVTSDDRPFGQRILRSEIPDLN